ncbi:hypothetical protein R6258_10230 [Halomonas sp. HP20-15]|uniref:hypothetical protein n=1 Tax=Halomonas sp. HP20-15 TaxID=3085901 RepID=UPI00298245A7|nr:hypothetical protein [Halomonas sp. HP20-15]MDW5377293.1 hypothetical protein [Halomonas sp. HP20-15]
MKHSILVASLLAVSLLAAGCQQLLPQHDEPLDTAANQCLSEIPSLETNGCLLESWVAFGLAAQRGDVVWRENILAELDGDTARQRLARAVVLSWAERERWKDASEIYKADLAAAPSQLQPLLRQWLNGLEGRRALVDEIAASKSARNRAIQERDALAEKLDALTAIEQSINSRQQ